MKRKFTLFPSSYDLLFNRLLDVLKSALAPKALKKALQDVGQRLGKENSTDGDLDERVSKTLAVLKELGGAARIVKENGQLIIKSEGCPFAESVAEHPEVCKVAESMVGEIVKRPVRERCDRLGPPKCCFEIDLA